ncbi:MAG: DegT/DnrJ/EryC1/StrS family aminotransferase [Gemmatimonadaceae bacterium]
MIVPFLDLKASYTSLQSEIDGAVGRVLASGWYIGGPEVEAFESEFAAYVGAAHCVAVSNGLEALQLALLSVGVEPGDEVIVPTHTFVATWLAVTQCGAVPVPVEVHPETYQLDAERIAAVITPRCKAIVPVHLYGMPANLNPILEVATAYRIPVVEDAAQAHGTYYHGQRIGGHGAAASWSFYPGKNLGAFGDAGAVTTNNAQVAARLRSLRNYGSTQRYVHDEIGFNSRLDPIQASILRVKLLHLDAWNSRRREIASRYQTELAGTGLVLPFIPAWADSSWHLFPVRHPMRDALREALADDGIETLIHYPVPPHRQRAYADLGYTQGTFPIAEELSATVLSLPIGPAMTDAQVAAVIEAVRTATRHLHHAA